MEKFYKVSEIQKLTSLSRPTIMKAINSGELFASFMGNKYLVSETALVEWIKKNRVQPN